EALFPEVSVSSHPGVDIPERRYFQPAGPPLRVATARDQSRLFQDFEMLRNGRHAHVERRSQFRNGRLTLRQLLQDGPPCRVCQCPEYSTELVIVHDPSGPGSSYLTNW